MKLNKLVVQVADSSKKGATNMHLIWSKLEKLVVPVGIRARKLEICNIQRVKSIFQKKN